SLGRIFARIDSGITNKERVKQIGKYLKKHEIIDADNCWICSGLVKEIQHFADLISESLEDYQFETFIIGVKIDEDIIEREQKLLDFTGSE
ncbi:unnamed protein product, partial [marine sediment metagenome]